MLRMNKSESMRLRVRAKYLAQQFVRLRTYFRRQLLVGTSAHAVPTQRRGPPQDDLDSLGVADGNCNTVSLRERCVAGDRPGRVSRPYSDKTVKRSGHAAARGSDGTKHYRRGGRVGGSGFLSTGGR